MTMTRRRLCSVGAALALVGASGCLGGDETETGGSNGDEWTWSGALPVESVVQHHDPSCGCCHEYVDYLERHEIDVQVESTDNLEAVKREFGVPEAAMSCHTIEVGDYLVEGHVPLEAIEELLADEPAVDGISAPGMPQYSPGMGPRGDEPLTIYAFETSGEFSEYTTV
ncbi:DUF411 domain-containing protein [Natronorubrum thiooxidans]|uniref:Uncharacterized conserved protein n=1 Tax=Natronorubrum thiooxidans TaxID=308853 RepID=A0A1N7FVI7_9EURY|nr:DUF411 domain-containing protein [Natronorubrum thiooxidans]SIS04362.1 Uncharacterized conserved protein [Natronorubrum thiooxidans]